MKKRNIASKKMSVNYNMSAAIEHNYISNTTIILLQKKKYRLVINR